MDLNPEFERRVLDAYERALDWPATERRRRIRADWEDEPRLLAALLELLDAETGAAASLPTELPPAAASGDAPPPPPERIGVYRLGALLGEGGMGAVYRGERADGLFEQSVAIKLIRPTLFSARVAERFGAERRILAGLNHPNIAQLFDGGFDANGNPYLVMELIAGQPIDEYVRASRPDLRGVIGLVRQVCLAVQHAHQNLVVHADIKPGNVVVTPEGLVKLLDFGIARLLDVGGGEPEPVGLQPLTPAYASPECRAGQAPRPAADIYAIGVLLYQLVAGHLPHASTALAPAGPTAGADSDPPLPGDLDAIARKAMHRDPAQRYAMVGAIVDDLNRFLDHRPVLARGDDFRYLARCFIRRNRWGLLAAGVVTTALVATSIITSVLYLRAEAARVAAAARFDETRSMARFMLFDLYDQLAGIPGTTAARRLLAAEGRSYLGHLARVPDAPAAVALETAVGYRRLALVLGTPGEANLGRPAEALAALVAGRTELERLLLHRPADARVRLELARNYLSESRIRWIGDTTVANSSRLNQAALAELERVLGQNPDDPGARAWRWAALAWQADNLNYEGRAAEALRQLGELRAIAGTIPEDPEDPLLRIRTEANIERLTGDAHYFSGDKQLAAASYRRALQVLEQAVARHGAIPSLRVSLAVVQWSLGGDLTEIGRSGEGLVHIEQAEAAVHGLLALGPDAWAERMQGVLQNQRAEILGNLGHHDEAAAIYRRRRTELENAAGARDRGGPLRDLAVLVTLQARNELRAGRIESGCRISAEALALWDDIERRFGLGPLDREPLPEQRREHQRHCPGARAN